MKKLALGFVLVLMLVNARESYASGFHLSSIGGVPTNGIYMSKFWHTSSQPTIKGMSLPGEEVKITIDDKTLAVNADSAGEWLYIPVDPLSDGDHNVLIESAAGSQIKMTLTTGKNAVENLGMGGGSNVDEALPTVGSFLPTLLLTGSGLGLVLGSGKILRN